MLRECLTDLLGGRVVVVRWVRAAGGLILWLQVPTALVPQIAAALAPAASGEILHIDGGQAAGHGGVLG